MYAPLPNALSIPEKKLAPPQLNGRHTFSVLPANLLDNHQANRAPLLIELHLCTELSLIKHTSKTCLVERCEYFIWR